MSLMLLIIGKDIRAVIRKIAALFFAYGRVNYLCIQLQESDYVCMEPLSTAILNL